MSTSIIITVCVLLLLGYIFDVTAVKTKIPSVILLFVLGWLVRQVSIYFSIVLPDLNPLLPVLGTIGLILIVLEGSLELELNKTKIPIIRKSFIIATIPMLLMGFFVAAIFYYYDQCYSYKDCLVNAIPFCVISSAIAIPSASGLSKNNKEFIIYETSLSDIVGVLFFNFVALNATINLQSFGNFALQIILILVISFLATVGLSLLLNRINHHIKFAPIVLIIILIYVISKVYHLPGLIFIMLFGLFLGNLDEIRKFKWFNKINAQELDNEVSKFKGLVSEATFLTKTLFFLLFGYLIETAELFNPQSLLWAVGIVVVIYGIRWLQLLAFKIPLSPLLFISPRGLITILLFLAIEQGQKIPLVSKPLVIQVIVLTALIMMIGLMFNKKKIVEPETIHPSDADPSIVIENS